jgi:GNAT superfamily N-acetyltransferase
MMIEGIGHNLRRPRTDDEWRSYHAIRREVLFENRGLVGIYNAIHPDELQNGNHPLIMVDGGVPIGVIRVDVRDQVAWFRRVAVRQDLQRVGHGRRLLNLAETFARKENCTEVRSNVAVDAVGFYQRCGYSTDLSAIAEAQSILMFKLLE